MAGTIAGLEKVQTRDRTYAISAFASRASMKKPGWLRIVDLDRADEGLLQVSQQPMFDLQRQLKPPQ